MIALLPYGITGMLRNAKVKMGNMLRIVKVKTVINAYKKNEIGVVFAPGNLKRLRAKGGTKQLL